MPQRPPLSAKIIYALGQFGWSLTSFGAANLLVYFYFPAETSDVSSNFPTYIYQGALFGIIAILGLINFGGRIFDGITDPLIANWSDKTVSNFGKRRKFMAWSAVPFAVFSFLIFYPISDIQSTNTYWLFFTVFAFFLFMTLYTVPYTALISELGHHPEDRMLISTLISVAWAMGFLLGNMVYALQAYFEQSQSPTEAFQTSIGIFAVIGFVFMLLPVFFLNEKKYALQKPADYNAFSSVASVFSNRNFRFFISSDLLYWLALTFIQLGVSYYITILMDLDKAYASMFMAIGFLGSFLLYIPINILVKKWGKKRLMVLAFWAFSLVFGLTYAMAWIALPKMLFFYLLAILSAFPLATFGIVPNAIIADIVYEHQSNTGEQLAGMFYGVRNFMMKMGIALANLIFPSLLILGKSVENPLGVQLSSLCAFLFCLAGWLFFSAYQEETVATTKD